MMKDECEFDRIVKPESPLIKIFTLNCIGGTLNLELQKSSTVQC